MATQRVFKWGLIALLSLWAGGAMAGSVSVQHKAPLPDVTAEERPQTRAPANMSARQSTCKQCGDSDWLIHDSTVKLRLDHDADGFYRTLEVSFDVDSYRDGRWVWARLYFSVGGSDWESYAETEDFYISGNTAADIYGLETDLIDGYPHDYYDVLIEIFDARNGEFLTSAGPNDDRDLALLPLEDEEHDYYYLSYEDDRFYFATGSMGSVGLLALALLGLCRLDHRRRAKARG